MSPEDLSFLTRPIVGIENRTGQEAFDMMCDRIRAISLARQSVPEGMVMVPREPGMSPVDCDPMNIRGSCEDPRLAQAGYIVCGSNADREWHWKPPVGDWRDGYRSETAAVKAALLHLPAPPTTQHKEPDK